MSNKQSDASSVGGTLGSALKLALVCLGIVGLITAIALKDD